MAQLEHRDIGKLAKPVLGEAVDRLEHPVAIVAQAHTLLGHE